MSIGAKHNMFNNTLKNLKYTKNHEWARQEKDGTITVGITECAQQMLGDIVFVELPAIGTIIIAEKECGIVESVKSVSDIHAPISGEVITLNDKVTITPSLLNSDPQGEGWLFKIRPHNNSEFKTLMSTNDYNKFLETNKEHQA